MGSGKGDGSTSSYQWNRHGTGNPRRLNKNKGNVVIVMDDAWETQYTKGYPTLEKYNMKASIAVPPAFIKYPVKAGLRAACRTVSEGCDLLNHTFDHEILETFLGTSRKNRC